VPYVPIYRTSVEIKGRFVACPLCHAPVVDPIPPHWPVTLTGGIRDAVITPHLPKCPHLAALRKEDADVPG
jgi:hypothetical protein